MYSQKINNMKTLILLISVFITGISFTQITIYDFKVETIEGDSLDLATFKGKKVMIVNTASKCGLTPQYEDLQSLYDRYKDQNFVIIGFPSNDFMKQEPGSNAEIAEFCKLNFGVTFPMMSKVVVKGENKTALFKYLTTNKDTGGNEEIKWNFQKFLINEKGELDKTFLPSVKPLDKSITTWIEGD